MERSDELYDRRLLGLSVRGKNISGLQERVNITINFTTSINVTVLLLNSSLKLVFVFESCLAHIPTLRSFKFFTKKIKSLSGVFLDERGFGNSEREDESKEKNRDMMMGSELTAGLVIVHHGEAVHGGAV